MVVYLLSERAMAAPRRPQNGPEAPAPGHTAVFGNNIVRVRLMQELAAGAPTYAVFVASKRSLLTWRDNRRVCGKPPSGRSRSTVGGPSTDEGRRNAVQAQPKLHARCPFAGSCPRCNGAFPPGFHGGVDVGATGEKCSRCLPAAVAGHKLVPGDDTATETPGT